MQVAMVVLMALFSQLVDRTEESLRLPPPNEKLNAEQRGDTFMTRKMYREGVEVYQAALLDQPSARLYNKIGIGYHYLGQFSHARRSYERATRLDKTYGSALNNLGALYYARHRFKKAIRHYRKALHVAPTSAAMHSNLGTAYLARKKYKKAAKEYQIALQIDPLVFERRASSGTVLQEQNVQNRAQFNFFMARAYAATGAMEKCLRYLRKAFEEGYKKRKKVAADPAFKSLHDDPIFQRLVLGEETAKI